MATATTALPLQYSKKNSKTTRLSKQSINASANIGRYVYYFNKGLEVRDPRPNVAIVKEPFFVEIISSEDGYVAISGISNVYELGNTPSQAAENYLKSLIDELIWLQKHEKDLSASLREELHLLQNFIWIV